MALSEFIEALRRNSDRTADNYDYEIKKFARELGKDPDQIVQEIKTGKLDLILFLRQLNTWSRDQKHRSTTTLLYMTSWIQFLRFEDIEVNRDKVKTQVRPPMKIKTFGGRPFTKEEIKKLFDLVNFKYRAMFLLAATSGMRAGEIGALKIGDVDFSRSPVEIFVRGPTSKSRRDRTCFCSDEAATHLKAVVGERKKKDEYLFSMNGGRFTSGAMTAATSRILERADMREKTEQNARHALSFHSFRKFFTTYLINDRKVQPQIVELLCGREIGVSQSYFMPSLDQMRETYAQSMQGISLTREIPEIGKEVERRLRDPDQIKMLLSQPEVRDMMDSEFARQFAVILENWTKIGKWISLETLKETARIAKVEAEMSPLERKKVRESRSRLDDGK
jgi:integrase